MQPMQGRGWRKRRNPNLRDAQVPKHRASKDTKRWCKGINGREHVPQWEFTWGSWITVGHGYPGLLQLRCAACRKVIEYHICSTRMWPGGDFFYGPGLPTNWGYGQ
jgi:hypothetical protein